MALFYPSLGRAYFSAVTSFGIKTILTKLNQSRNTYIHFLQTHLTACAKEQCYLALFIELLQSLYNQTDFGFAFSMDELDKIIHFKVGHNNSAFQKTALGWAVQNGDLFIMLEMLKLEHHCHVTEEESIKCLQYVDRGNLLSRIYTTYIKLHNFFPNGTLLGKHSTYKCMYGQIGFWFFIFFYSDIDN
jgi:hypothetical protein